MERVEVVDAGWPSYLTSGGGVAPEGQDLDQLVAWPKGFFA
jgi:hypothetical protein